LRCGARVEAGCGRTDKGNPLSDKAVVVTGVDTANDKVHLNNGGTPGGKDETVSIALLTK